LLLAKMGLYVQLLCDVLMHGLEVGSRPVVGIRAIEHSPVQ
jgi:hypothetical protein